MVTWFLYLENSATLTSSHHLQSSVTLPVVDLESSVWSEDYNLGKNKTIFFKQGPSDKKKKKKKQALQRKKGK